LSTKNLDKIFSPKNIAVVGASSKQGSVGYSLLKNMIGRGFEGTVYPVNPNHKSVQGIHSYTSIKEVPAEIDLAVVAVPAKFVPGVIQECADSDVGGAVIVSAGFGELDEEGKKLEQNIAETARKKNMRLIGPNCLGIIRPPLNLNASFAPMMPLEGSVAFVSQSGALCTSVIDWATYNNIGFSNFVSIGSMLDVDFGDLIDYFGEDSHTHSIILYIESIKDARSFMSAASGFARSKPIIVVKSGRFAESAEAAASHTGALAGEDAIYDAAFKRAGVLRVYDIEDLFNCAQVLGMQPRPSGKKLCIITNAGGPGVMATDELIEKGGELASLNSKGVKELDAVLPKCWSRSNPVDILGDAKAERYDSALRVCAKKSDADGILAIFTPQDGSDATGSAKAIIENAKLTDKPVFASFIGETSVREAVNTLHSNNIPNYFTPEDAVSTFMNMYRYKHNVELLYETPEAVVSGINPDKKELKRIISGACREKRMILTEAESKNFMKEYGIHSVETVKAENGLEAGKAAEKIGFPVVLKIDSKEVTHKSDVGGVILNLQSTKGVETAFTTIMENVKKANPDAKVEGVTVQRMINKEGYEVLIGSKKDSLFGSVIVFGAGGTAVEVMKDRNIALPPLTQTLARRLMEETKVFDAMKGYRHKKPANIRELENMLIRFSYLLADFPEIKEVDMNPVLVDEQGAVVLDARIILESEPKEKDETYSHLAIRPYPKELIKEINVDGKKIMLKPNRPEYEPMEAEMFKTFSEKTMKYRFFRIIKEVTHDLLVRYTHNDYDREIGIIAEAEEKGEKKMLGVVRLIHDPNNESAEFAIVVGDPWQGKGLGSEMMDYILEIARKRGLKQVYGTIMKENRIMVDVCKARGFEMENIPEENAYKALLKFEKKKKKK